MINISQSLIHIKYWSANCSYGSLKEEIVLNFSTREKAESYISSKLEEFRKEIKQAKNFDHQNISDEMTHDDTIKICIPVKTTGGFYWNKCYFYVNEEEIYIKLED